MRIGLIKERKIPIDTRVAITPGNCAELIAKFIGLEIVVESSQERCFSDEEYTKVGISVVHDMSTCDVLLGVKEVPKEELIAGKTYLFFSHTIKLQPHNRALFQNILKKNITLIDYECLHWPNGGRILGFGNWAGIVGTYNSLLVWGKKTGDYELKPAWKCHDYEEVKKELAKVKTDKLGIALTGDGRVAAGSIEVLNLIAAKEVDTDTFKSSDNTGIYFVHLDNSKLYKRLDGQEFESAHFYKNHEVYKCVFNQYLAYTDLLINGMYWEQDMEVLFTKEEVKGKEFSIQVIADITCDIEGSVPITIKDTVIKEPVFGWDRDKGQEAAPYGKHTVEVMAVSNLPAELPRNASEAFGEMLSRDVLSLLLFGDDKGIIKNATLTKGGKVQEAYAYLNAFGAE
jgi:saccharopine dehydrogenase (NAD+, L-lysine forming)